MKVSTAHPFQLIYSLYQHEYLGYLFESFVIQLDDKGRLTFQNQNISAKNAAEFASGLCEKDYQIIKLMDEIQQEAVVLKFYKKKVKPNDFFLKVYDKESGDKALQEAIQLYLESRVAEILSLFDESHMIFEMGKDGEPAWKRIHYQAEKATVLFHFRRNEDNTHYFPTIKHLEEKVEWQYKGSYLVCQEPAWMVVDDKLLSFEKNVDGRKLKPFLNKKFIVIPRKVEETYYQKFVTQLVSSFDVYAKGFQINTERYELKPKLFFSELVQATNGHLFDSVRKPETQDAYENAKILFKIGFGYGPYEFEYEQSPGSSVRLEKVNDSYVFHKVKREGFSEIELVKAFMEEGLGFKNGRFTLGKGKAFEWLSTHKDWLEERGIEVVQTDTKAKEYFVGESALEIKVEEGIDWFDINAIVRFGDYEIPFNELRKLIRKNKLEIKLPNGQIAVIPEAWIKDYSELFAFIEEGSSPHEMRLKKHHLALVQDLRNGRLAKVTMDRKLEGLRNYEELIEYDVPKGFKGQLRPYQKAGYDWMRFLANYNFGGCLADDMGLGKTVQTLSLLQHQKDENVNHASLLIMPTSLMYNWQLEAKKFTPKLKVLVYAGTNRNKNPEVFHHYDIVITSYGITRIDIDIL